MTNEDIIMKQRIRLMKENKIGSTGRFITIEDENGVKTTMLEPEEIHTFSAWMQLGYMVKKGEKAIAQFIIWKYSEKKRDIDGDGEDESISNMFMKKSSFFSVKQVSPIE